jgi:hypothetical protein
MLMVNFLLIHSTIIFFVCYELVHFQIKGIYQTEKKETFFDRAGDWTQSFKQAR